MYLSKTPLIPAEALHERTHELAAELAAAYEGRDVVMLVVLKGAALFAMDLAKAIDGHIEMDFMRARSYTGTASTGNVHITIYPEAVLQDRDVLIVEDILDTGLTARTLVDWVRKQKPASLAVCALLDKPTRRRTPLEGDFVGFTIDDYFVVGYGLDYNERYRNLPAVYVLHDAPKEALDA